MKFEDGCVCQGFMYICSRRFIVNGLARRDLIGGPPVRFSVGTQSSEYVLVATRYCTSTSTYVCETYILRYLTPLTDLLHPHGKRVGGPGPFNQRQRSHSLTVEKYKSFPSSLSIQFYDLYLLRLPQL